MADGHEQEGEKRSTKWGHEDKSLPILAHFSSHAESEEGGEKDGGHDDEEHLFHFFRN